MVQFKEILKEIPRDEKEEGKWWDVICVVVEFLQTGYTKTTTVLLSSSSSSSPTRNIVTRNIFVERVVQGSIKE
ncbi:hypothetical protein Pcinc_025743 [Petrolisthes cinctipes]|uniref:Uncharacterized protein n=1 Tax=Petrolisthes cinctipes TaxID=88211 RepID=A0AAE1F9X6_PETCI|nr:hypothetical protein Pcinc_025743 [Petrolisthes cinctipes]